MLTVKQINYLYTAWQEGGAMTRDSQAIRVEDAFLNDDLSENER